MAVGEVHIFNDYHFRETASGPMVWGQCFGCGKRALTSFDDDGNMREAGCETCLRAKHGASLSYYGTDAGQLGRHIRHAPGLSGDVISRSGIQPTYRKGKVVLVPEPQYPETVEPLRWLTVGEHVEIEGPKGALDLAKVAGYRVRMAYCVVRPVNHRARLCAYLLETVAVRVTFADIMFWTSWERRRGVDATVGKWTRNGSFVRVPKSPDNEWHRTTAAEMTREVKRMVRK